jgi:hypothetical protein
MLMETCTYTVANENRKEREREIKQSEDGDRRAKSKLGFNNILRSMTRKNPSLMHTSQ